MTASERERICDAAWRITKSGTFFAVNTVELTLAAVTFGTLALALVHSIRRRMLWSRKIELIVWASLIILLLHNYSVITTRLYYEVMFFSPSPDPCDYTVSTLHAMIVRVPFGFSVCGMTLMHVAFCVERAVATYFLRTYERAGCGCALLLVIFVYLATTLFAYGTYANAYTRNSSERFYLTLDTLELPPSSTISFVVISVLDVAATIFSGFLLVINRRQKRNKIHDYELGKSYQLRENHVLNYIFVPTLIVHSVIFTLFLILQVAWRMLAYRLEIVQRYVSYELIQTIYTISTLVMVAMYAILQRRILRRLSTDIAVQPLDADKQTQIYWRQFEAQLRG